MDLTPPDRRVAPPRRTAISRAESRRQAPFAAPTVGLLLGLVASVLSQWWAATADGDAPTRIAVAITYAAFFVAIPGNTRIRATAAERGLARPQPRAAPWQLGAGCVVVGCGTAVALLIGSADGYPFALQLLTAYLIAASLFAIASGFLGELAFMPTWPPMVLNVLGLQVVVARLPQDSFDLTWLVIAALFLHLSRHLARS